MKICKNLKSLVSQKMPKNIVNPVTILTVDNFDIIMQTISNCTRIPTDVIDVIGDYYATIEIFYIEYIDRFTGGITIKFNTENIIVISDHKINVLGGYSERMDIVLKKCVLKENDEIRMTSHVPLHYLSDFILPICDLLHIYNMLKKNGNKIICDSWTLELENVENVLEDINKMICIEKNINCCEYEHYICLSNYVS